MKKRSCLIIAEAGVNHNGSLQTAIQLIDAAAIAGADVVKFQTFIPSLCVTADAQQAKYQTENMGQTQNQLEMLDGLTISPDHYAILVGHCHDKGLEFLSTAFDSPSIEFLLQYKLKRWKIPSGEITNLPYLRHIGGLGFPIILSTGMANLGEIESSMSVLEEEGILI